MSSTTASRTRAAVMGVLLGALLLGTIAGPLPLSAAQEGDADLHPLISFAVEQSRSFYLREDGNSFAHAIPAPYVVLSRVDTFADSLAASILLRDSVLLFTETDALPQPVTDELARLMPDGGTVYLLGGTGAISPGVEDALTTAGHDPVRVAGPSRVETAIAIADLAIEMGIDVTTAALARADGPEATAEWADAIAAAPWSAARGAPILLTPTDQLHPAVQGWLGDRELDRIVVLGGEAAVSAAVTDALPAAERFAGPNRFATAVTIADDLYTFTLYNFRIMAGDQPDGWGYALAGVPLAVEDRSPMLLVGRDVLPAETDAYTCSNGSRARLTILGGVDVIRQDVRDELAADCPSS